MLNTLKQIWNDERGFVNSMELILIATLAVLGLIVGLATFRDAVTQELADTGAAVGQLNQSYSVSIGSSNNQNANNGPAITNFGPLLPTLVRRNFAVNGVPTVRVRSGFMNYGYADSSDIGDGQDTPAGQAPPGIVDMTAAPSDEGN